MTRSSGTKLSLYEILSPIGAGGMGEVYLANDSKPDRQVAIKVLPETMTRDPGRVARLEREAKRLASLNHPNIAAIHGFDESNGTRFLIMEYVEGETLGSHLKNGLVAVEEDSEPVQFERAGNGGTDSNVPTDVLNSSEFQLGNPNSSSLVHRSNLV